jgi:TonB family protein
VSAELLSGDLLVYAVQILVVGAAAALISVALRLRAPGARLLYWQTAIGACLLLPALRHWKTPVASGVVTNSSTVVTAVAPGSAPAFRTPSLAAMFLALIAAGIALRMAWLLVGLWRLRRYRMRSREFEGGGQWKAAAELRISDDVASPVTFGYSEPVVLLPPQFMELGREMQEAILCHEVLHVWRRDWLWTLGEEIIRGLLWFHPAIWWMLGEAQLAREETVDRLVIETTGARERYLDALLVIAGAPARLDLAPAPLFLRRRHLKQRVISIVKEVRMSKARLISTFAASAAMLAGVCWMITGALPLTAAPQNVNDAPGVSVQTGAVSLMHRAPVIYPQDAMAKGIQGTVVVQAKLGADGSVADALVVSGPEELRKAALESVLNWHFDRSAAGSTQQVTIEFTLPAQGATGPVPTPMIMIARPPGGGSEPQTIKMIGVSGLSDEAKAELMAQLPFHEGDSIAPADYSKLTDAVRSFDSHLMVSLGYGTEGLSVRIMPRMSPGVTGGMIIPSITTAPPPPPAGMPMMAPSAIRVGGNVQQMNLISQVQPAYPPEAKAARVQGKVRFDATIGADGHVENLHVVSGPPLLVNSAMEAVRQWVYKPTLLNGQPVKVITQVDVNYTLSAVEGR